jgi:hypothetical protein
MSEILPAVCSSAEFVLEIAFSACESHELYEQFHVSFRQRLDIDLSDYHLESDPSAIVMSVEKRKRRHLICLRHFLLTLKQNSSVSR